MSDQENARQLANLQLPFLVTDTEHLRREEDHWHNNQQALQWESQLPGLFPDLVPNPSHQDDSLMEAATVYFGAATLLSPLIEDAAAKHLSRRKEKEIKMGEPFVEPATGEPVQPDFES